MARVVKVARVVMVEGATRLTEVERVAREAC